MRNGGCKMEKKKYYAITTSMTFEKTVLVPVDDVQVILVSKCIRREWNC